VAGPRKPEFFRTRCGSVLHTSGLEFWLGRKYHHKLVNR